MKLRGKPHARPVACTTRSEKKHFSLKVALWLLDSPRLGDKPSVKHLAGRMLKQPARQGVVVAQSRLGQMLCRECGNARDRRIGHELLRQAARAGDRRAQLEYARLCQGQAPEQARYWLELAAGQGSQEARRLLRQGAQD
ncbi:MULTISPECIES: tetratricopeptide repeat protein [Pseudomonas]|jgi:TPR repeat protein|uniref:Sel1 repeat family protein n=1 Tax=Pseudomonas mosselii TaxID=78327 RepID=A0A5R8Z638_9PSED|nr:sel1 repeat family protein [Pseudomonas mosselii]TLP61262.1 sel1 repeat family protein [Pseudomonas mosselii]